MNMPLELYKIYCTVVSAGNMSLASKQLHISQPAVSMAIKQLEGLLGNRLLVRYSKGIKTTPEGKILYEYLNQAFDLVTLAEQKYFDAINLNEGEIKIGASDTLISQFLLPYFERFHSTYSHINIKVTNRTTYETLKLLKAGKADIGFVNLPIDDDPFIEVTECMKISDCLIGGYKFRDIAKTGIRLTDIIKYPLLLLEKDSNSRKYIDKYCSEKNITLNPIFELGSCELLIKFVRINLGLSIVTREFSLEEIDNESIFEIPVTPDFNQRSIGFVKVKNVPLSYSAMKFLESMKIKA